MSAPVAQLVVWVEAVSSPQWPVFKSTRLLHDVHALEFTHLGPAFFFFCNFCISSNGHFSIHTALSAGNAFYSCNINNLIDEPSARHQNQENHIMRFLC